ncbi:MAG TPA: response regulator [Bryobacteraceae bacterium]|nr:response regulator [Bryobacteraceae bacterium]
MAKGAKRVILVVDHDLSDLELMCKVVRRQAHQALPASGYLAGLNTAHMHIGEIDLLVTAVALPGKNGCELAKRLLEKTPDLKVLFVSAPSGAEICRYYGLLGEGAYFLEKPLAEDEFKRIVQLILEPASGSAAAAGQQP